jgi:hypothetical protein
MPNLDRRTRRAIKQLGIGLGVMFLMLNSYVTTWAALPRVGQMCRQKNRGSSSCWNGDAKAGAVKA